MSAEHLGAAGPLGGHGQPAAGARVTLPTQVNGGRAEPSGQQDAAHGWYLEPQPDRVSLFLSRTAARLPRWTGPVAGLAGIGSALLYTVLVHPTAVSSGTHPTCVVRILTGFDCPGCGGTRAAWYLMHGDLIAAARHHAPLVFAAPFLVYLFVVWALNTTFGLRLPQLRVSNRALLLFLAGWAVWSVLRNLPWAPFSLFYV